MARRLLFSTIHPDNFTAQTNALLALFRKNRSLLRPKFTVDKEASRHPSVDAERSSSCLARPVHAWHGRTGARYESRNTEAFVFAEPVLCDFKGAASALEAERPKPSTS